ncbi:toll/interleukin-1 receptor domain-containing protein [Micromonospora zingiberis]|uniref:Toll/interleukin-1 receptor domain-containing protein n=1 Tax=Micromonospora zingiberis TaxID=2053011 RepID=A0A4R0G8W3_9ACTN|nr:FxSxx-COOH system tetratricopeptide repeat protein [Micromonospora zingiberis]TCB93390.1 toll/interleukin-1 receptor domain-containing protein [Micromonospora zingiberis]
MTTDASARSGEKLFISYAGPDRPWAEWVAWHLEQAGYTVELDLWDWAAGDNAVVRMSQALDRADRVVALFSEDYFEHQRFTTDEWTAIMSGRDRHGRLIPLRLADVTAPPVLRPLVTPSLAGLSADDAHRVLLNAVRGTPPRPATAPDFPGGQVPRQRPAEEAPRLPGAHQPTLWRVPHRNAAFVGRDRDIDAVRRRLRPGQPVVVQSTFRLGGVGKTQVAAEYAHRFAAQYDLVAWLDAEQPHLVPAQLTALATDLGLVTEHGEAAALPALRRHLQQPMRWLLVFDNAETTEAVQPWLPAGFGHVLVTSRSDNWPEYADVTLELLTRRESVTLLRSRVTDLAPDQADAVADKLGDLPLALTQAATTLRSMPAQFYLELLDTDADELLDADLPPSYPRSLAAALRLSINGLADHGEALHLLRLCCVMAPEPIPMSLLTAAPTAVAEPLGPVLASPMRLYRTAQRLGELVRLWQRGIQVHRLVQTLVLSQLDSAQRDELRRQASVLVAASHPGDPASATHWPAWSQLMPHLLAMKIGDSDHTALRDTACDALLYLLYSGDTNAGIRLAKRLYEQWRQTLGPDDRHTLAAAAELAHAYHKQGLDREALALTEDTLDRRQRTLGPDAPATLRSANDHVVVLASLGRLSESRDKLVDVLARRTAVLGGDHPDTLTTRNNLANWIGEAGNHRTAITSYEQLLTDRLRVLGPDHPYTLATRNNLASWIGEAGDHRTAITSYERLLTDQIRVLGPDHPDTLTTRSNLANVKGEAGDDHAAITSFEELLTDQIRILGPDHPHTLATRGNLASLKGRAGDHRTAITSLEQLLTDRLHILGPDHPHTLTTRNNLANWIGEAGDHNSAITSLEQLLTDQIRILGPDHPDTLATRSNLASLKSRAGDHRTAITSLEQLLTDQIRILGPDHPHILTTRSNLAELLLARGAVMAARTQAATKLEAERRLFGPHDRRTQQTQHLLDRIKARMGGRPGRGGNRRRKR